MIYYHNGRILLDQSSRTESAPREIHVGDGVFSEESDEYDSVRSESDDFFLRRVSQLELQRWRSSHIPHHVGDHSLHVRRLVHPILRVVQGQVM